MSDRLDWLVFGDDWGAHVSTTQHLIRALPPQDRVVWVDSIGMRTPTLTRRDLGRLAAKATSVLRRPPRPDRPRGPHREGLVRVRPAVVPAHRSRAARALNGQVLRRQIRRACATAVARPQVLLTVNPVTELYRAALPDLPTLYLRLDDYAHFPGVEPALVHASEPKLMARARTLAPAAELVPPGGLHLPQGVDVDHFAQAPLEPPGRPVLGFFGLVGARIDDALVAAVARAAPDWTFEFVGRVEGRPPWLTLPNVRALGPRPYAELPRAMARWQAAWTPYRLDADGLASNPLKVREYLAAGLPTHCTPIPAVRPLLDCDAADAPSVVRWVARTLDDDAGARAARRARMAGESWHARAGVLRAAAWSALSLSGRLPS